MNMNKYETEARLEELKHQRRRLRARMKDLRELLDGELETGRKRIERQIRKVQAYYATHWRDDDNPKAEETDGVCGRLIWTPGDVLG